MYPFLDALMWAKLMNIHCGKYADSVYELVQICVTLFKDKLTDLCSRAFSTHGRFGI